MSRLALVFVVAAAAGCSGWFATPWTCSTVSDCAQWCDDPAMSFEGSCVSGYCVSSGPPGCVAPSGDAGPQNAGPDAGRADAGGDGGEPRDGGPHLDAGVDAGPHLDAGVDAGPHLDAGLDAGPVDAGTDAGPDGGPRVDAGTDAGIDAGPTGTWISQTSGTTDNLTGITTFDSGDTWTVGTGPVAGVILQYVPASDTWIQPSVNGAIPQLYDVSGATDGTHEYVWAVGPGALLQLDASSTWHASTPFGTDAEWGVWATSSTEVWSVGTTAGSTASVWHLKNGTWTSELGGLGSVQILFAVWAPSTSVVWGAAANQMNNPLVTNWVPVGATWTVATAGLATNMPPSGIGGTSGTDVWVATADSGALVHWDGNNWTTHSVPGNPQMTSVWAASSTDVWAVGFNGTILHFNGNTWTPEVSGTTANLNCIRGNTTTVWVSGSDGTILRRGR